MNMTDSKSTLRSVGDTRSDLHAFKDGKSDSQYKLDDNANVDQEIFWPPLAKP